MCFFDHVDRPCQERQKLVQRLTLNQSVVSQRAFNWAEFLRKWPEHLRGDAFCKLQKIDLSPTKKYRVFDHFYRWWRLGRKECRSWNSTNLQYPSVLQLSGVPQDMARALTRTCVFENWKKSWFSTLMVNVVFRPCRQGMTREVEKSTEAETVPVCSIPAYFNWVEFLRKWLEHLRGDAFSKLQKSTSRATKISIFRPILQYMASAVGKSADAVTLPVCSILQYFSWVDFLTKWLEHLRGHAVRKLQIITF